MNLRKALFAGVAFSFALSALAQSQGDFFNEIFDSRGRVRAQYTEAYEIYSQMSEAQKERFLRESRKAFMGDNALDPMPRILTAQEFDATLKPGVQQRADALRAFLQDHHSGRRAYARAGVIPRDVVDRIIQRSNEQSYKGLIPADQVAFMYGPDIIRDRRGNWRVIEDNPGFIGGLGDMKLAQDHLLEQFPELKDAFRVRMADEFYDQISKRFKARAADFGGVAVLYMTPPYADNEDNRVRKLFADRGIPTVTPNSNQQLRVTPRGVYLYDKTHPEKRSKKVGYVVLNGEHSWLDMSHPVNYERWIVKAAENIIENLRKENRSSRTPLSRKEFNEGAIKSFQDDLNQKKIVVENLEIMIRNLGYGHWITAGKSASQQARGLTQAFMDRKVGLNYTPGIDFIGDKEFYLYVEELIRFYLKEEPIIKNIPTERFANRDGVLNEVLLNRVFNNLERYVIKKVDGRGGDAVWVGPKINRSEVQQVRERILGNPSEYIVQEFTPLSRLNDNIVDVRVITEVGPKDSFVTDTPWGRGLPKDGNGKVNLSDKGREVTVLIHEGAWGMCKNTYLR
ncbi:MAG: circularly permuted type 2 ATP-grasp protein [Pseudobdellovibrionaceae bacterium]